MLIFFFFRAASVLRDREHEHDFEHGPGGPLDREQLSQGPNSRSKYDTEKFENLADLLGFLDFVGDWR